MTHSCPNEPMDREWQDFVRMLDRDERDLDGRLLKCGSRVLCHPLQPQAFREDSPANRQEFLRYDRTWTPEARQRVWFPPISSMPADFASRAEACRSAKKAFLAAIDENMVLARDQPMPEVNSLPLWFTLLAWEPKIKEVIEIADLSDSLASRIAQTSGVPGEMAWPREWQQQLVDLNVMRVYALSGMTATVHVVAAFLAPLHFRDGSYPELLSPAQGIADFVREIFQDWVHSRRGNRAAFTFFTVGSAFPWPAQVTGQAAADYWLIVSSPDSDGTWETKMPPRFADRLSLRDFLDRLKPVTQQQRISKIKLYVDELLESGYEGNIHREKIAKETGYRRTAVHDALLALRDSGHYRLYKTSEGVTAIGRKAAAIGTTVTAASLRRSWLPRLACLGPAIGVAIWFAKDVIIRRPFEFQSFVVLLPLAYAGEWLNTRFRKWRENKE